MMGMIRSPFEKQLWAAQRTVGKYAKGRGSGQESTKTIKPGIEFESWDEEWRYRKGAVRLQSSSLDLTPGRPVSRPIGLTSTRNFSPSVSPLEYPRRRPVQSGAFER
jgi:hypothetical protein